MVSTHVKKSDAEKIIIEHNFGIPDLGHSHTANSPASSRMRKDQQPRPFQHVSAAKDETYFLNDKTFPTDPDDGVFIAGVSDAPRHSVEAIRRERDCPGRILFRCRQAKVAD